MKVYERKTLRICSRISCQATREGSKEEPVIAELQEIMRDAEKEQPVINRLVQWAKKHESIRAMLLYSSRTDPNVSVDIFSDKVEIWKNKT